MKKKRVFDSMAIGLFNKGIVLLRVKLDRC